MSEDTGPYDLEPRDGDSPPSPPPGTHEEKGDRPKPRIEAETLLSGFDEDADFSQDPEVEAALAHGGRPRPGDRSHEAELADPSRWLIRPGFPSARVCVITAAILTIGAVVFGVIHAPQRAWLAGVFALYETLLAGMLGLFALASAAYFSERRLNEVPLGLARVLVPTSCAMLILRLNIPIPTRSDEALLAGAAYYLLAILCFRLPRFETRILALSHFLLWLFVRIGIEIGSAMPGAAP